MSSSSSLNHFYRTVWNEALGAMVAVAEIASSSAGSSSSMSAESRAKLLRHGLPRICQLSLAVACCWGGVATSFANPAGGVAVQGQASMANSARTLTVTTQNAAGTNRSVINWQSFSIPAGNSTRIEQPNAASLSINQVVTNTPSLIYGNLSSNGQVVLVNQSGITIGSGGLVDTAGFTATTLGMTNADAASGPLRFANTGIAGDLDVQGRILVRGGDVVLSAPKVQVGAGASIEAQGGSVMLAAAQSVDISGRGLEGIQLRVQAPTDQAVNLGSLQGDAVGMFAGTLRHSGLIRANQTAIEGGRIVLKATGDTYVEGQAQLLATSAAGRGGNVDVLGNRVALLDTAHIDAYGAAGGGSIRIGGDKQGKNPDVLNATMTHVAPGVVLNADAVDNGNGGRVIVWSEDVTRTYGQISVRGGAAGGEGGFVETSGKRYLDVGNAFPDVRAPKGKAGEWLLDPEDVTISVGGPSFITDGVTPTPGLFQPNLSGSSSILSASTLSSYLATSGNATVDTSVVGGGGSGLGNITVTTAITPNTSALPSGGTLTLRAHNDVVLATTGSIVPTGKLNVVVIANQDNSGGGAFRMQGGGAAVYTNSGSLTVSGADHSISGYIQTNGGAVDITGTSNFTMVSGTNILTGGGHFTAVGSALNIVGNIDAGGGGIKLQATSGGVSSNTSAGGVLTANSLEAIAAGSIQVFGNNPIANVAATTTSGLINVEVNSPTATVGSVGLTTGLTAPNSVYIRQYNSSGGLTVASNVSAGADVLIGVTPLPSTGGITINSGVTVSAGTNSQLYTGGGAVTVNGTLTAGSSNSLLIQSGNTNAPAAWGNISGVGALSAFQITLKAADEFDAGNGASVNLSGAITAGNGVTVNSGTGTTLSNSGSNLSTVSFFNKNSGLIDANSSGNLTLSARNLGSGGIKVQTTGSIALNGQVSAASASGDAVKLAAGTSFNDNDFPIVASAGRYLIYAADPSAITTASLPNFQQYSASYPTAPAQASGNGFLYSATGPAVPVALVGTVSKTFDGTTTATLNSANYSVSGTIADTYFWTTDNSVTPTLVSVGSGSYASPNAGTGLLVTSTGGTANAVLASGTIFGLTLSSASASIGTINPLVTTLSLNGTRVYDGTASFDAKWLTTGVAGLSLAGAGSVSSKNVGSYTLNPMGLTLSGTNAANYTLTGGTHLVSITPASITAVGGLLAADKVYDGRRDASLALVQPALAFAPAATGLRLTGVLAGDDLSIAGGKGLYADIHVGVDKPVEFSAMVLGGKDAANYVIDSKLVSTGQGTITQLSTANWSGPSGGSWSNADNWLEKAVPMRSNVGSVVISGNVAVNFDLADTEATKLKGLATGGAFTMSGVDLSVDSPVFLSSFTQQKGDLNVLGDFTVNGAYNSTSGLVKATGAVNLTQTSGALVVGSIDGATVNLTATSGAITQGGSMATGSLVAQALNGIQLNNSGNKIGSFQLTNTAPGPIEFTNVGVANVKGIATPGGNIVFSNTGGVTTTGLVATGSGSITGTANSPLTIGPDGLSATGDIVLTATNRTSAGNLTLLGDVNSSGGAVSLAAGQDFVQNGSVFGALGVAADIGGAVSFGPDAQTKGQPVRYVAGGVAIIPPGAGVVPGVTTGAGGNAPTDFVLTFLTKFDQALEKQVASSDTPGERKKDDNGVVVEGQTCTR